MFGRVVEFVKKLFGYRQTQKPVDDPSNLHVIAVFFNFQRYKNPVKNFKNFETHMKELGVTLHIVELVLKDADFQVTNPLNPNHTRLRTQREFFQKENLINLGVKKAKENYPDMEYFAWIDADVRFFNPNVVQDTIYELNRNDLVQMWSRAVDLDPDMQPLEFHFAKDMRNGIVYSAGYCFQNEISRDVTQLGCRWHPGYAWAMRYSTWEKIGGLYDRTPLGSGDMHNMMAFLGRPWDGIHGGCNINYKNDYFKWSSPVKRNSLNKVGYVKGLLHHHWHGKKSSRKYVERWNILIENDFDPDLDLMYDDIGQLHLTDRNPKMHADFSAYFQGRDDDCNRV